MNSIFRENKASPKLEKSKSYIEHKDFGNCNDGNTFLGTLLANLTVIEAEVITFDQEVFFLRSNSLQYYFVGLECA